MPAQADTPPEMKFHCVLFRVCQVGLLFPLLRTLYYHVSTGILWLRKHFHSKFFAPLGCKIFILTFNPELTFSPLLKHLMKFQCGQFSVTGENKNEYFLSDRQFSRCWG